jgi:hypothetical protein
LTKSGRILLLFLTFQMFIGCGGGGGSGGGNSGGPPAGSGLPSGVGTLPLITGNNVVPITVNGALCSNSAFVNKACVSVTICTPGTSTCQVINDIILDTASFGLRIFKQALSPALTLTQVTVPSGAVAECIQFGGGSSDWGPVQVAGVVMGNEPAVQVPIQVIDSTFAPLRTVCLSADIAPASAGFNGILGAGLFIPDCGTACSTNALNGLYYSCTGATCTGTTVPLASQVQNPVALLPVDNNGMVVQLPSVLSGGAPSADGFLILGIGTQANNTPSGVTTYPANPFGEFFTVFNGTSFNGVIDTGTGSLIFPSGGLLPNCATPNSSWFCPPSLTNLSATNEGAPGGVPSGVVPFQIGNFVSLAVSGNKVFPDIGGNGTTQFIWGLPFFFGRPVYIGIQGRVSSLGTGPYWAY